VRLREDLLLLEHSQHSVEAGHVYQHLVQQLPKLSLTALIDDLERMTMVVGTNAQPGTASRSSTTPRCGASWSNGPAGASRRR